MYYTVMVQVRWGVGARCKYDGCRCAVQWGVGAQCKGMRPHSQVIFVLLQNGVWHTQCPLLLSITCPAFHFLCVDNTLSSSGPPPRLFSLLYYTQQCNNRVRAFQSLLLQNTRPCTAVQGMAMYMIRNEVVTLQRGVFYAAGIVYALGRASCPLS